MITELGILGTIAYLAFLGTILYNFAHTTRLGDPLSRGLFAGAIALFIINITTPALFQGFGVLYFIYLRQSNHKIILPLSNHLSSK
jgi:O-antigen ligase